MGNMKADDVEARTAVVGVGGAGCNVIDEFYWNLPEFDTIAIDYDVPDVSSDKVLSLQSFTTDSGNGLRENDIRREVAELLRGYDIVYVISGLGGRIGSPISPLVVDVATNSGCMVTSIAIMPSSSGAESPSLVEGCISDLKAICPMTIVIDNGLVPEGISDDMKFDVVNRSIVSYVEKHRGRLISAFVRNLSKNVREALRNEGRSAPLLFAQCLTN